MVEIAHYTERNKLIRLGETAVEVEPMPAGVFRRQWKLIARDGQCVGMLEEPVRSIEVWRISFAD